MCASGDRTRRAHSSHAQHGARLHRRAGRASVLGAGVDDGDGSGPGEEAHQGARIPFHVPGRGDLVARMTAVLEAVYGAYVIDWATTGQQARQLPLEALHLAEVLTTLVPADPEAHGLAALVQLSAARAPARVDANGCFVPLADQDPS